VHIIFLKYACTIKHDDMKLLREKSQDASMTNNDDDDDGDDDEK
jgi:hypothetical protein